MWAQGLLLGVCSSAAKLSREKAIGWVKNGREEIPVRFLNTINLPRVSAHTFFWFIWLELETYHKGSTIVVYPDYWSKVGIFIEDPVSVHE